MAREEAARILYNQWQGFLENNIDYAGISDAYKMAIKALRYQPIVLQEHDAEPRRLRAILDTVTEEIYVCRLTKQDADTLGITIEEVEE